MESVERIVEAYAQSRKGLATIAKIRCDGEHEIGLLAIDPVQPSRRFQIECAVSISTGRAPEETVENLQVQTLRTRRAFEAFVQQKFDPEAVILRLKELGVVDAGYRKIIVAWDSSSALKAAAAGAGVELWSLLSLSKELLAAFGEGGASVAGDEFGLLRLLAQAKSGKAKERLSPAELWRSRDPDIWDHYEGERYEAQIKPELRDIERRLEAPELRARIARMSAEAFHDFLSGEFYRFVFVSKPRLYVAVRALDKHVRQDAMNLVEKVRLRLVNRDWDSKGDALRMIMGRNGGIHGLSIAEASALLALVYPEEFAPVDAAVAKALQEIGLAEVSTANPRDISAEAAETMIEILRLKALELNRTFNAFQWTPRRVARALWVASR